MKSIFKEFKQLAIKGNMFDMAVGIIIGTAFNKIVSSIVNDLVMPWFGYLMGKVEFKDLQFVLQEEIKDPNGSITQTLIAIKYGSFLQIVIDFLIISLTIFVVIKIFNKLKTKSEDVNNNTVTTPKDIQLLSEIRDILKEK